jgi:hypothetical protein
MNRSLLALVVALGALAIAAAPASASGVAYPDADWSEAFIPSSDGVMLHADVLRPKGSTTRARPARSADWKLGAGHRIGVRVTDNNRTGGCSRRRRRP